MWSPYGQTALYMYVLQQTDIRACIYYIMYNNIINMLYIIMTARTCGQLKNATRKHPYIPMGADHPRFNRFPGPPADPAWDQTA